MLKKNSFLAKSIQTYVLIFINVPRIEFILKQIPRVVKARGCSNKRHISGNILLQSFFFALSLSPYSYISLTLSKNQFISTSFLLAMVVSSECLGQSTASVGL